MSPPAEGSTRRSTGRSSAAASPFRSSRRARVPGAPRTTPWRTSCASASGARRSRSGRSSATRSTSSTSGRPTRRCGRSRATRCSTPSPSRARSKPTASSSTSAPTSARASRQGSSEPPRRSRPRSPNVTGRPGSSWRTRQAPGTRWGAPSTSSRRIYDRLDGHPKLGLCLDSCHLWVSGTDVTDPKVVDETLGEVDRRIGLDRLRCLHVNDADSPLGSNRDRHENICHGAMGEGLGAFLAHPRVQGLPAILETPGPGGHGGPTAEEVQQLKDLHARWAGSTRPGRSARRPGRTASRGGARKTRG